MNDEKDDLESRAEREPSSPSALTLYFRDIAKFPVLSREEEQKVAHEMAAGVAGARDRLIVSNLRLVAKIAQEYVETGMPLIDLIQEGNIGLIEAVDRYEPERGYRLGTYAAWWIRRAMLAAIGEYTRMIRIPDYLFRAVRRMAQIRSMAEQEVIGDAEVSEVLGLSVDRLRQVEAQVSEIVSLDRVVSSGESDEPLEERIADETGLSLEQEALRLLFRDELDGVLAGLPARQALAIRLHYGIEDGCPYNFADVGRIMKVSRERARQLVQEGMNRVSERWGERALEMYKGLLNE
ncbi:MAG: RNA polymerase sigma factor RpoD/SigA [Candidatus Bipolaricaulis sp.]|nr:RNA polymerase sigma factor RpoD/SigA [Candidatus Bipolaricaulis sp.]